MTTSSSKTIEIVPVSSLDWPCNGPGTVSNVQCAGQSFLNYESRLLERRTFLHFSSFSEYNQNDALDEETTVSASNVGNNKTSKKHTQRNLLELPSRKLDKLTYYQILGDIPLHSNAEQIKRAYHRACLKYHPDKTGRGEEDEVFLKVKAAFDTLSDVAKRKSYDSTVDFDDRIPRGGETEEEFYAVYRPVFERNLRFDARRDPARDVGANREAQDEEGGGGGKGGKKKKKKKGGKRNSSVGGSATGSDEGKSRRDDAPCPDLGDSNTPIEDVNAFYDYWTHFDSWRDFTLKATERTEHDVESADCREEKRWMQKEIDRKAKAMKRDEIARIATLVERAMAADPRLRKQREREREEKARREAEKADREAKARKEREEKEAKEAQEREKREAEEKERKASAKATREREKKLLRKAKQLLRKLAVAAYVEGDGEGNAIWGDMEAMNDDVELLCSNLTLRQITTLTGALENNESGLEEVRRLAVETKRGAARRSLSDQTKRDAARAEAAKKEAAARAARASRPWTKEELSALAKAIKKYPPGGANRWDAICHFVNNVCEPVEPRTREECIERYNLIASGASSASVAGGAAAAAAARPAGGGGDAAAGKGGGEGGGSPPAKPDGRKESRGTTKGAASKGDGKSAAPSPSGEGNVWTEEQDRQLQGGLAKYPSSMDKNERWTAIARGVDGKGKKDCVMRFKAIRSAIKKK